LEDESSLAVGDSKFEELDSSEVKELEAKAGDILEKSEELIEAIFNDPDAVMVAHSEIKEESLEEEIDAAFDLLMNDNEVNTEEVTEEAEVVIEEPIDTSVMDLSSFISAKIAHAEVENIEEVNEIVQEVQPEEVSEEKELADALDQAFANLIGDDISGDTAADTSIIESEDLDIDIEFLNNSLSDESDSKDLD